MGLANGIRRAARSCGIASRPLRQQMKPHKCQYLSDNLPRGIAIMHQVKRVRSGGMIREGDRQIAAQSLDQKAVDSLVEMRNFVLTCSHYEQR